ncbi:MAG: uroporphyrinogen decarboxylase family protein [Candidatus Helarchaeota archaeon]
MTDSMSPLERVLTTVKGGLPDRVPIFPLTTSKSADVLNISLPELYKNGEYIFQGQQKLRAILGHDFVLAFFYLVKDAEPWGATALFFSDGSPNLEKFAFKEPKDVLSHETPSINDSPAFDEPRKAIQLFAKSSLKGTVPIVGALSGPFSLPTFFFDAMHWLETLLVEPKLFKQVLDKIIPFTIEWANIQIELGVDLLVLIDGMVSTTILPPDVFQDMVVPVYKKLATSIKAPIILGGAGGTFQPVVEDITQTGIIGITLSSDDDLSECKRLSKEKITLFGNLNNIEFVDWTLARIEEAVKESILSGTEGLTKSRYVLMNQHSFPHDVPLEKIKAMVEFGMKYGRY